jgi:hypothetical protein
MLDSNAFAVTPFLASGEERVGTHPHGDRGRLHRPNRVHLRAENMREHSAKEKEALDAFRTQRALLDTVADRSVRDPAFMKWRIVTQEVFKRYLSSYQVRFMNINFTLRSYTGDPQETYLAGIETSKACLDAAIEHIERWGLEKPAEAEARPAMREDARRFNFYAPIQNLAVAMDNAVQNVNQSASDEGTALKQIGDILRQSGELKQKEVAQALEIIANLATEMHKPKTGWSWKNIADWTNTLLEIAKNATDATAKLATYLPVMAGLYDTAVKMLR